MAVITIDGKKLEVSGQQCVLESALQAGIYIPHLCHHPDLPESGSCRLCVVEVEGVEKPVPSCTLKAKDGMVIHTKSERLSALRAMAMELLLAGHPEDCSTCPKYGSCELQTLMQYLGGANPRMKERIKGFKENLANPLIEHDMNRCVLCGRCVRACRDLRGVGVLDYRKKDMESYVGTLHDRLLADADCRFCQACAEVCPTGTIRDKLMIHNTDSRPKAEVVVPCRAACPAHTDVPRYVRFVKEGNYDAAAAVIREKAPFPKALGHICTHVCELQCKRGEVSDPLAIREIKRSAAEHDTGMYWKGKGKQLPDTGRKVCVVGGGPAGMTAAYYLRKQGHDVTLGEALPTVGGMMSYGIPAYRLPREVVAEEYSYIEAAGIHTEVNTRVENPVDLLKEYDAVLMAVGAQAGVRLPIEGNDLDGVLIGVDFLRQCSMGQETGIGERVIVLGGGNVAIDCARSAIRLGAKEVHMVCRKARDNMTGDEEEVAQALEEGMILHPERTFEKVLGDGKVTGVECMKIASYTFDENHRARIVKEEGSAHQIEGDTVIFATGQRIDMKKEMGLELGKANSIVTKPNSAATSVEGIFAAGDAVYGTKSVIMAIEAGRQAASEIDRYLGGDGDISEVLAPAQNAEPEIGREEGFAYQKRIPSQLRSPEERRDNFELMDFGICDSEICAEAGRCLQCDLRLQISEPRLWSDFEGEEQC